jgi:hypothetical protein
MITRTGAMGTFRYPRDVSRLALLVGCVALATTRLGLLAHELVGHGGTALACGARVDEVRLFWFAGGWIHYRLAEPSLPAALAISMGGIAVELLAGAALWLAARGPSFARRLVRAVGTALVIHASWYLATGAFHGYGDGALLYRELGDARIAVALAAGAITCTASFFGARSVLGALAATLPGSTRARIAGTIVALAVAGGVHAALAAGELAYRRDAAYTAVMTTERERLVAREYARWEAQHDSAAPEIRQAQRAQIEREHPTFPFAWLLAGATALAVGFGAWRSRGGEDQRISQRMLAVAGVAAAAAICAVIALGAVFSM